ncbi:MAG: hypothetical protein ACR2QK_08725 [Acidimicrobiales bacterium]
MDEAALHALETYRFPGGTRTLAQWENHLLADATESAPMPDGLAHPVAAFNLSIQGAGTSIAELFDRCEVADAGAVWLEAYDWDFAHPLREEVEYRLSGGIDTAERGKTRSGRTFDRVVFSVDIDEPTGDRAVRATTTWRIHR